MSDQAVLYDIPGPKARRRYFIGTIVVTLVGLAVAYLVVRRLADRGQFDSELWAPLYNPGHEDFVDVWQFLGRGLRATLTTAVLAIAASLVVGTALGSARMLLGTSRGGRVLKVPLVVLIELFRGLPVVVTMFLTWAFFRFIDFRLAFLPGEELMWYVAIGLTLYNSVIIAEILRAGVASLPRGQSEAARAVGMSEGMTMRLVLLPQAFRIMLPALISQLVVILKDTSLGAFIAFLELLNRSQRLAQRFDNPLQTLLTVALIYIAINYALSRLAVWTEARVSRSAGGPKAAAKTEETTGAVAGA
jgi:glutamate transport system permease protein